MTCISTFFSLKDLIAFTYMKMGFHKLLDPIKSHAVFTVKDFSAIPWEESVYIQY